jgi:hypothetical protein
MKKLYPAILLTLIINSAFANPVNTAIGNGNWKTNSTWSLNRVPANGDTVVIPAGKTVTIDNVQNLSTGFLYVKISGTLKLSGGKLWVDANSAIVIYLGGALIGTGNSSETLRINGIDKFWGHNDVTVLGPAYANSTTGVSPNGFTLGSITLPVIFLGFTVSLQDHDAMIQWATAEEINSSYFEVQKSNNGTDWNTIADVSAAGNTTLTHSYSYMDKNISGKVVYYRIKQVDIDGKYIVTPVRLLKNENDNTEISVAGASNTSIYLQFSGQIKNNVVVRLTSMSGQVISQQILNEPVGQVLFRVQNTIKGIYVVSVTDGQNLKFSKQLLF